MCCNCLFDILTKRKNYKMDAITTKDILLTIIGAGIGAIISYYYNEFASKEEKKALKKENLEIKEQLFNIEKYSTIKPIIDPRLMFQDDSLDIINEGNINDEKYIQIQKHNYKVLKISYDKKGEKKIIILFNIGYTSPQNRIEEIVNDLFGEKIPNDVLIYEYHIFTEYSDNTIRQFLDVGQLKDITITEEYLKKVILQCIYEIKRQFIEYEGPESLYNEKEVSENLKKQLFENLDITKQKVLNAKFSAWKFR